MADLKTKLNDQSVTDFVESVEPEWKKQDAKQILNLLHKVTGEQPKMWGNSIIGFGKYHYKYESGREGDWFLAGFSPRKQDTTIYMTGGFDNLGELLTKLGKHKKSVGCLYLKKLEDVNIDILEKMIQKSIETYKKRYAAYN
ncbi:MAG: DUF1801 domain-containing protein [Bacteroidota bacterium]